ncbi:MAG: hypothetical protein F6J90_01365 [Moorea sp. SIOASIH]|uniref:hypothetical protein n=1 Tax=Moorena sp. SIOASIH TaxID=2607817 RepID=UPI0013BD3016|nr:hypothetical protein [Moorena sp. SIOASIH]NEO35024.1 hypothetical protein [Moorena sp. SIOASIH]
MVKVDLDLIYTIDATVFLIDPQPSTNKCDRITTQCLVSHLPLPYSLLPTPYSLFPSP